MKKEKIEKIINELEGITFIEWTYLSDEVNRQFNALRNKNTLTSKSYESVKKSPELTFILE